MKDVRSAAPPEGRTVRPAYAPGDYVSCNACGKLLKIGWATRSIICSCGARVGPPPPK